MWNRLGGVLFKKLLKYELKTSEALYKYASGKFKEEDHLTLLDYEILIVIYSLDTFLLFIYSKKK